MAGRLAGEPNRIGDNMDLTSLSDDDLAAHHIAVVSEQECRQRLASIPEQIADLTARYLNDGGDPNLLPTRRPQD